MTAHYNIKNNNEHNFKPIKQKFNIWIINNAGDVFVRNRSVHLKTTEPNHLTFESRNPINLIEKIKIICLQNLEVLSFKQIYSFASETKKYTYTGYLLQLNLDEQYQTLIEQAMDGKFIDYRDLEDILKSYNKSIDCLETYVTLLDTLDQQYGITITTI